MNIYLNKGEADTLNKIEELGFGDSAHCPYRFCPGEEIKLAQILDLILQAIRLAVDGERGGK